MLLSHSGLWSRALISGRMTHLSALQVAPPEGPPDERGFLSSIAGIGRFDDTYGGTCFGSHIPVSGRRLSLKANVTAPEGE